MAVGVPEGEVFAAADRVLARGERPTTERVRTELGRGSPALVGRLLEQWWDALSKRLAGESLLPDLPAGVAEAFKSVWVDACAHGREGAEAVLAAQQAQLTSDRVALEAERVKCRADTEAAEALERQASHERDMAQARLSDLQRLLDQQNEVSADALRQRDQLQVRLEQLELDMASMRARLHAQECAATAEREALALHVRAVEERTHAEVDRAREEVKGSRKRVRELERESSTSALGAQRRYEALASELKLAEQRVAAQQAELTTQAKQLQRFDTLAASLHAGKTRVQKVKAGKPIDPKPGPQSSRDAPRKSATATRKR